MEKKTKTIQCLENESNYGNRNTEERADTNTAGSALFVRALISVGTWSAVGSGWVGLLLFTGV